MQFRDVDNEFAGAPFRDEETKIMFAYDYENKTTIRVRAGANMKPALYNELKRLGVEIYDRVMATSLLTEGGKPGSRVIGATGVNVRTGQFYIFKAKATVLCTAQPLRIWVFSTELAGSHTAHDDPNLAGDGCAMAWKAGAEITLMEQTIPSVGGFRWPAYGTGNCGNTWYPCTMVDANGKEIPWVDKDGNVLKTVEERSRPGGASLIPDLPERIEKGENSGYGEAIVKFLEGREISWVCWVFDPDWGPRMLESFENYELTESGEFFREALHGKGRK